MQSWYSIGLLVLATANATISAALPAEIVAGKRFDPPRIYFRHGNLNKDRLTAIKSQDNFLSLYVPAIDDSKTKYSPDQFSTVFHLPGPIRVLDTRELDLKTEETTDGTTVTFSLDADQVAARCLRGAWGIDLTLWYRVDEAATGVAAKPARVELLYEGKRVYQSLAQLNVLDELQVPPRIDPKNFRFWLHYGPYQRHEAWDALEDYLRKAGINSIQFTLGSPSERMTNRIKALKQRGFYVIAQRAGSYSQANRSTREIAAERSAWFARADAKCMEHYLPLADAVLWDFEPAPARIFVDEWNLTAFRKAAQINPQVELSAETIRESYFKEWIDYRQDSLTTAIVSWTEFCKSIQPDIETILTHGHAHRFDPLSQIDCAKYGSAVTFCDPMNFVGKTGLENIRRWMEHVPGAQFTGCQNVALPYEPVFVSARATMLQFVAAALIGLKGTSIYPGWTMDGEDFVHLNRAANFLGRHQDFIFAGNRNPATGQLNLLPKEVDEIALGDGTISEVAYPDWSKEGIGYLFQLPDSSDYLAVVENLSDSEPCFAKLQIEVDSGTWAVVDDEQRTALATEGSRLLTADRLRQGVLVHCPKSDFRGYRIARAEQVDKLDEYRRIEISAIDSRYRRYASKTIRPGTASPEPSEASRLLLHINFETGADAVTSGGRAKAIVQRGVKYQETPEGTRAAIIGRGTTLEYHPAGNLDLNRGKLYIRFKPNWDGTDGKKHELFRIKPRQGLVYLGKLNDGRLLMNMFDRNGKQHYPSYLIRDMVSGEWQSLLVTWDAKVGAMSMFLNGTKVADKRMPPWRMAPLSPRARDGRIVLPPSAEAAIDEIKIWDRP